LSRATLASSCDCVWRRCERRCVCARCAPLGALLVRLPKLVECRLHLCLHCQTLGDSEGQADGDAHSLASPLSSAPGDERLPAGYPAATNGLAAESSLESFDRMVTQASEDIKRSLDKLDEQVGAAIRSVSGSDIEPVFQIRSQKLVEDEPLLDKSVPNPPEDTACGKPTLRDHQLATSPRDSVSEPSTDLMDWCRTATKDYANVHIHDFCTSWRNGLAFCALIHHFR